MAKDSKIRLPSGMGGLTRYFEDSVSRLEFAPGHVILLCVLVILIVVLLNFFAGGLVGV